MCAPSSRPVPVGAACVSSALPQRATPKRDAQCHLPVAASLVSRDSTVATAQASLGTGLAPSPLLNLWSTLRLSFLTWRMGLTLPVWGCPADRLARLVGRGAPGAPGRWGSVGNAVSTAMLEMGSVRSNHLRKAGQHLPFPPQGL